jgi:hypothetical protein
LLALQAGREHLLGPLGGPLVVLEDLVEEFYELLIALLLGVLNVALERFDVLRRLIECADQVIFLSLGCLDASVISFLSSGLLRTICNLGLCCPDGRFKRPEGPEPKMFP